MTRRFRASHSLSLLMAVGAGFVTWYGMTGGENAGLPGHDAIPTFVPGPVLTGTTSESALMVRSGLPTRLVIPSAEIDAPVRTVGVVLLDGQPKWETTTAGIGHHMNSALPGQPGNAVFTGHVSLTDPRLVPYFARLEDVRPGDVVFVYSGVVVYRYQVDSVNVVGADEVSVLESDHRSRITLITCTRDLKGRLVVGGHLVANEVAATR